MIIEKKHHDYLFLQRGDISHITDMAQWKSAYALALANTVHTLDGAIGTVRERHEGASGQVPKIQTPITVLDIGGGLGGIHTLISKALASDYHLSILDGINDPPVHKNSWQTFNNAEIGKDFLIRNGLKHVEYVEEVPLAHKFDLIVSFAAYGFHIHPGNYLGDLKKAVDKYTVLVFDVRRSKKEWLRDLVDVFGPPTKVLHTAEKYVRLAFNA